jgi:flagellar motor switch protein FliG
MPVLAAGEDLAAEHPAVIAYLLKSEDQQVRVSVLRALPGQVARAVMRRLRST